MKRFKTLFAVIILTATLTGFTADTPNYGVLPSRENNYLQSVNAPQWLNTYNRVTGFANDIKNK